MNVSDYLSNPQNCQCKESEFSYEPHGHVITGDPSIIENAKRRELVVKGPSTKNQITSTGKLHKQCFLNPYAKHWPKREQEDRKYFSEWKDDLKELVGERISDLSHLNAKSSNQPDVKDTLHKFHSNYVLIPADKAAKNVIVVCKKYHIDTINNPNNDNPTYVPTGDSYKKNHEESQPVYNISGIAVV